MLNKVSSLMVKRQHYISEGILKNFLNDSKGLYEVLLGQKKIYGTTPPNAMCESFLYETDGIEINTIENDFTKLEDRVIPILDKLILDIQSLSLGKNLTISDQIKKDVELLLPSFLVFYYRSNALLEEYSMGKKEYKVPLMLEKIYHHRYIFNLATLISKNYKFSIIQTEGNFLISDQYISTSALKIKGRLLDISNRHIGLKDTLLLIPLSSKFYFAFWHSTDKKIFNENKITFLDSAQTLAVNRTIINNSYSKCVSPDENLLINMTSEWRHQSPSQIYIGHTDKSSSGFSKKKELFYFKEEEETYKLLTEYYMYKPNMLKAKGYDQCPCKSKKIFKNCHKKYIKKIKSINKINSKRTYIGEITIDGTNNLELPIDSWGPMSWQYK